MLILTDAGTDKLQLVTSAAASIDVHADWADVNPAATTIVVTPGRTNTAIVTAATTDIVAKPATNFTRNVKALTIRNKSASLSCDVTVLYNQNGTTYEMHKATLIPGALLEFVEGIGFFTISSSITNLTNESVTTQSPFSADTYLAGSSIAIPANLPVVGTAYKLVFDVTKTAAATTTALTVIIRIGTAGAIGDTARLTFTFGAQTAAADVGRFEVLAVFRTVGSGTNAVLQGLASLISNLATTGLSNAVKAVVVTSGGFDSTVANSFIGASYNGQASAAHSITLVRAELIA